MKIANIKQRLHSYCSDLAQPHPLSDSEQEIHKAELFQALAHHEHALDAHPFISSNDRNAVWYFLRAALRGHHEAAFKLGESYLHGDLGLDKDYKKAQYWLERAVALGHPEAKAHLYTAFSELAFS
ncbi:tetratricopeptide repeat protein [Acinetobacter sp. A47]|uniref:tetratricopeptide repeat protein n=1 Tax=Acinetobacter sp. A47 TaxID=1561217 RepID=UPI000570CBA8|nr:SEL1-like repeat protein [Acinetobacter sp. A47]